MYTFTAALPALAANVFVIMWPGNPRGLIVRQGAQKNVLMGKRIHRQRGSHKAPILQTLIILLGQHLWPHP